MTVKPISPKDDRLKQTGGKRRLADNIVHAINCVIVSYWDGKEARIPRNAWAFGIAMGAQSTMDFADEFAPTEVVQEVYGAEWNVHIEVYPTRVSDIVFTPKRDE